MKTLTTSSDDDHIWCRISESRTVLFTLFHQAILNQFEED